MLPFEKNYLFIEILEKFAMFSALKKVKILVLYMFEQSIGGEMHATVSPEFTTQSDLLKFFHQTHKPTDYSNIYTF